MNLNRTTALALRAGAYLGMAVILIGLIAYCMDMGEDILYAGILILIASPFVGVLAAFFSLLSERDWRWAAVAAVLIAITVTGLILSL